MSVGWYIGCPGAGKTTLAKAHAAALAQRGRKRLLLVDAEGDERFSSLPPAAELDELANVLVTHAAARFDVVHASDEALRDLPRWIENRGRFVVLVDGAHELLSARSASGDAWVRLQRVHRHAELDLLWTTHHLGGDVPQVVQACAPDLYVFRTTAPAALATLEREYGLNPSEVRSLERGNFLRVRSGFVPGA
jgi:hypothetical protein